MNLTSLAKRGVTLDARSRPLTIVEATASAGRTAALGFMRAQVAGSVPFVVPANVQTLRGFVHSFCSAIKPAAPGARFSFSTAFETATAAVDPTAALARWLSGHLQRSRPLIVVDGMDRLGSVRREGMLLVAAIARGGAATFVVALESTDGLPLSLWLAEGITSVPLPLPDFPIGTPAEAAPHEAEPGSGTREALIHAIAAGDVAGVSDILRADGFAMIERGDADAVEDALSVIGLRSTDATIAGLFAYCESRRDRVDVAESWFRNALEWAGDMQTRALVAQRFAGEFVRRKRMDVVDVLLGFLDDEGIAREDRAAMHALVAEGCIMSGNDDAARIHLAKALAWGSNDANTLRRARLGARAAYVYLNIGDFAQASAHATETVRIADAAGFDDIAASASSVLQAVAYESGGPDAALRHLYAIADYAVRSANTYFYVYALTAALELEVERANDDAIEAIEHELQGYDVHYAETVAVECLVPARALVAAWNGEFQNAYDVLAAEIEHQSREDPRSLRSAEAALYAAAGGNRRAASTALSRFEEAQFRGTDPRGLHRAELFACLARWLLGEVVDVPAVQRSPRDVALNTAVAAVVGWRGDHDALEGIWLALEGLHAYQYGGIARLIAALPLGGGI